MVVAGERERRKSGEGRGKRKKQLEREKKGWRRQREKRNRARVEGGGRFSTHDGPWRRQQHALSGAPSDRMQKEKEGALASARLMKRAPSSAPPSNPSFACRRGTALTPPTSELALPAGARLTVLAEFHFFRLNSLKPPT